jgi:poly(hydroxyalkanoate) depolymerase family esterase
MRAANANDAGRLGHLTDFGANPGELDARMYTATDAPTALIVVLLGCTQTASTYDRGSAWSKLAERHGFALLFPQQRRANHSNLCFNWFLPSDARRGHGEAASISQMVKHLAAQYGLDRSRIFITGLSAGGAMTSVMLACYPELFAGGAVIAGLPFSSANSLPEALERMRGRGAPPRHVLAARAMEAGDHTSHSPTLSVWHGTHDATGNMTSFFVFASRPGVLGSKQTYLADLVVPYLHGSWVRSQVTWPLDRAGANKPAKTGLLTPREQQILQWIYHGKSNIEIGMILDISPLTVKNHVQKTLRKLNVLNRTQAVGKALALRLVNP